MRKTLWKVGLTTAVVLLSSSAAYAQAQTDTAGLNVTVTLTSRARLTLSAATILLPDADPIASPSLVAPAIDVNVGARTAAGATVTLTVLASGDLTGSGGTIAINNLSWLAPGTGFADGTANATTAQSVGSWTGSGLRTSPQTYRLLNSWDYAPGTYATTMNYTLTVP
jgi:hypothetical protein